MESRCAVYQVVMSQSIDAIDSDFALFEGIMEDVEANEREKEEFFKVDKKLSLEENEKLYVDVTVNVQMGSSRQSFHIDNNTTPDLKENDNISRLDQTDQIESKYEDDEQNETYIDLSEPVKQNEENNYEISPPESATQYFDDKENAEKDSEHDEVSDAFYEKLSRSESRNFKAPENERPVSSTKSSNSIDNRVEEEETFENSEDEEAVDGKCTENEKNADSEQVNKKSLSDRTTPVYNEPKADSYYGYDSDLDQHAHDDTKSRNSTRSRYSSRGTSFTNNSDNDSYTTLDSDNDSQNKEIIDNASDEHDHAAKENNVYDEKQNVLSENEQNIQATKENVTDDYHTVNNISDDNVNKNEESKNESDEKTNVHRTYDNTSDNNHENESNHSEKENNTDDEKTNVHQTYDNSSDNNHENESNHSEKENNTDDEKTNVHQTYDNSSDNNHENNSSDNNGTDDKKSNVHHSESECIKNDTKDEKREMGSDNENVNTTSKQEHDIDHLKITVSDLESNNGDTKNYEEGTDNESLGDVSGLDLSAIYSDVEHEQQKKMSAERGEPLSDNHHEKPKQTDNDFDEEVQEIKDSYDEVGDKIYNLKGLELVSEEEYEAVNIQEVQEARAELSAFTMNFNNFSNIITELEKIQGVQEEKPKSISFDLDNLEEEKNSPKSSEGKKRKKKKIEKKSENDTAVIKTCNCCKNSIYQGSLFPELTEIFNDQVVCDVCCSQNQTEKRKKKRKVKTTKTENEQERINKEMKGKLDSRLNESSNEKLLTWLKDKDKINKVKRKEDRKERRERIKEKKIKQKKEEERLKKAETKVEEWNAKKDKEIREKKKSISASLKANISKPIIHNQNKNQYMKSQRDFILNQNKENKRRQAADEESQPFFTSPPNFEISEFNSFERFRESYLSQPETPEGFTSIESFVNSVVQNAVEEIERDNRMKQARLKRPKSHVHFQEKHEIKFIPTKPKSANPSRVATPRNSNFTRQQNQNIKVEMDRNALNRKLLRAKTYDEWLMDKNNKQHFKTREKEINEYYDKLEEKLIFIEKERRQALLSVSKQRVQSGVKSRTKLPDLSKRLEPQGSEIEYKLEH